MHQPPSPDAPLTLWTTRELERDRFRSADGRADRSVMMMMIENSRHTVALTDGPDSSPHWGQNDHRLLAEAPSSSRVTAHECSSSLEIRRHWNRADFGTSRRASGVSDRRESPSPDERRGKSFPVRLRASGFEFGCFRIAYGHRCHRGPIVGLWTQVSRFLASSGAKVELDVSIDGSAEPDRQVFLSLVQHPGKCLVKGTVFGTRVHENPHAGQRVRCLVVSESARAPSNVPATRLCSWHRRPPTISTR